VRGPNFNFRRDVLLVFANSNIEFPHSHLELVCNRVALSLNEDFDGRWDEILDFISEAIMRAWQYYFPHLSMSHPGHPSLGVILILISKGCESKLFLVNV
jgi:hypothetical protein